eukprot:TRINITY_DN4106_c0_g1_i1.p1 TRINITY_DN4106_c0_g1~~TRINITY_DN4106_c0_g1_i1.p1  ORF type:complete len:843 (+),score=301.48 TRINITY_DN4106_c0_g1_i1:39-2567(+)
MADFTSLKTDVYNWTLDSDYKLLAKVKAFSESVLSDADRLLKEMNDTAYKAGEVEIKVHDVLNKFAIMSNVRFTENRLEAATNGEAKTQGATPGQDEVNNSRDAVLKRYTTALQAGIECLNLEARLMDEDDNVSQTISEAPLLVRSASSIFSAASSNLLTKGGKLPFIFGTTSYQRNQFAGLYDAASESPNKTMQASTAQRVEESKVEERKEVQSRPSAQRQEPQTPPQQEENEGLTREALRRLQEEYEERQKVSAPAPLAPADNKIPSYKEQRVVQNFDQRSQTEDKRSEVDDDVDSYQRQRQPSFQQQIVAQIQRVSTKKEEQTRTSTAPRQEERQPERESTRPPERESTRAPERESTRAPERESNKPAPAQRVQETSVQRKDLQAPPPRVEEVEEDYDNTGLFGAKKRERPSTNFDSSAIFTSSYVFSTDFKMTQSKPKLASLFDDDDVPARPVQQRRQEEAKETQEKPTQQLKTIEEKTKKLKSLFDDDDDDILLDKQKQSKLFDLYNKPKEPEPPRVSVAPAKNDTQKKIASLFNDDDDDVPVSRPPPQKTQEPPAKTSPTVQKREDPEDRPLPSFERTAPRKEEKPPVKAEPAPIVNPYLPPRRIFDDKDDDEESEGKLDRWSVDSGKDKKPAPAPIQAPKPVVEPPKVQVQAPKSPEQSENLPQRILETHSVPEIRATAPANEAEVEHLVRPSERKSSERKSSEVSSHKGSLLVQDGNEDPLSGAKKPVSSKISDLQNKLNIHLEALKPSDELMRVSLQHIKEVKHHGESEPEVKMPEQLNDVLLNRTAAAPAKKPRTRNQPAFVDEDDPLSKAAQPPEQSKKAANKRALFEDSD